MEKNKTIEEFEKITAKANWKVGEQSKSGKYRIYKAGKNIKSMSLDDMNKHIEYVKNRDNKPKTQQESTPMQFKKLNVPKPVKDLTVPLNARIKQSNMNKLQKFAKENDLSVSKVVDRLVKDCI